MTAAVPTRGLSVRRPSFNVKRSQELEVLKDRSQPKAVTQEKVFRRDAVQHDAPEPTCASPLGAARHDSRPKRLVRMARAFPSAPPLNTKRRALLRRVRSTSIDTRQYEIFLRLARLRIAPQPAWLLCDLVSGSLMY